MFFKYKRIITNTHTRIHNEPLTFYQIKTTKQSSLLIDFKDLVPTIVAIVVLKYGYFYGDRQVSHLININLESRDIFGRCKLNLKMRI